jgi:hypothetical protein
MAFGCLRVGIRCRAALTTAIARKCYNMAHLDKDTAATAVGFVASDVNKIFEGIQEIHYLWGAPIEAAAILALLATLVGIYSLPGVGIVCAIVPLQYYFGFRIIKNKVANSANTNARYAIIQELLPAMKLVKYYAWERFFEKEVRRRGAGAAVTVRCCVLLCCWLLCTADQAAAVCFYALLSRLLLLLLLPVMPVMPDSDASDASDAGPVPTCCFPMSPPPATGVGRAQEGAAPDVLERRHQDHQRHHGVRRAPSGHLRRAGAI